MENKRILVLGATGKTGSRVAERLTKVSGVDVIKGSRKANPPFDWEDPTTWANVLEKTDAVYISFQPDLAVPSAPEIIEKFTHFANSSGVSKMVLLSGRGEKEAGRCEEIVKAVAKSWTIVRASWFNQNFSESIFLEPVQSGYVALPRADTLEPFTDADDIADVIVEALLNDRHDHQTYELTGPRLLTFKDAISEIASATGKSINFQSLSITEYISMLREYQVPEDVIWLVNYLFTEVLDGRNSSITNDIERVLGRKAKDFSTYVQEAASTGIWNAEIKISQLL